MHCRIIFVALTAFALLLLSAQTVYAKDYSMTQNVPGDNSYLVYMPINTGDTIEGNVTIWGSFSNEMYFSITDPQGNTILNLGLIEDANKFNFTAGTTGTYTLNFTNPYIWEKFVSVDVHTPEESNTIPPTPQTQAAPVETYIFMAGTALALVMIIALAIYAFARRGAPNKLTGQEKEIKILEGKMTFALLGAALGMLLLFSALTYFYTPYIFWATVLPNSFMQSIDPNASLIAWVSIIFLFVGFAVIFAMIALLRYYGQKLKRIKTQTSSIQSNPKMEPKPT